MEYTEPEKRFNFKSRMESTSILLEYKRVHEELKKIKQGLTEGWRNLQRYVPICSTGIQFLMKFTQFFTLKA